jgi:hypothetical protein
MNLRARQGGWAGLIGLVLALVIVALLVKTVLAQMGLLDRGGKAAGDVAHSPSAAAAPASAAEAAAITPAAALERARGLEKVVREQARENAERIDKATQ